MHSMHALSQPRTACHHPSCSHLVPPHRQPRLSVGRQHQQRQHTQQRQHPQQRHPQQQQQNVLQAPAACLQDTTPAAAAQSAAGRLVKTRVLRNRSGLFRIRHLQESDLAAVAQLQATCFYEALPLKPLDDLAYTIFEAEVLSAVQKKITVLADDGFTILVVESCSPAAAAANGSWPAANGSSSSSSARDAAVWYGDQQQQAAAAAAGGGGSPGGSGRSSSSRILGVIEVGVQDEQDVLRHLPRGVENYAYISSMAVAPHVRRCGIGAALLQAAEQQAALWDQQLLALHVYETNARAIKLYQSHGLVNQAADPAWRRYLGGKVRQLMVKRL